MFAYTKGDGEGGEIHRRLFSFQENQIFPNSPSVNVQAYGRETVE